MIILISPAKTFKKNPPLSHQKPMFLKESFVLQKKLALLNTEDIHQKMKLSIKLSETVYDYYQHFDSSHYKAIETYHGQVYKSLNYPSLNLTEQAYIDDQVMIVSGLYGLLRPSDSMALYRLEMQDQTILNLYNYWNPIIKHYINHQLKHEIIISLLSLEYEKVIEEVPHITITFESNKKIPSMMLKTLRGKFLRLMAINDIKHLMSLKKVNVDGFIYDENLSTSSQFVFRRDET